MHRHGLRASEARIKAARLIIVEGLPPGLPLHTRAETIPMRRFRRYAMTSEQAILPDKSNTGHDRVQDQDHPEEVEPAFARPGQFRRQLDRSQLLRSHGLVPSRASISSGQHSVAFARTCMRVEAFAGEPVYSLALPNGANPSMTLPAKQEGGAQTLECTSLIIVKPGIDHACRTDAFDAAHRAGTKTSLSALGGACGSAMTPTVHRLATMHWQACTGSAGRCAACATRGPVRPRRAKQLASAARCLLEQLGTLALPHGQYRSCTDDS